MAIIQYLFEPVRNPKRGLMTAEWLMMGYLAFTLVLMLFTFPQMDNLSSMLWGRVRAVAIVVMLLAAYRMRPCRLIQLARIFAQLLLLSWWYPDTYEFNRLFPSFDYLFAQADQALFGCQPALLFSERFTHPVISELMHLGYASYFPLIAAVVFFAFYRHYDQLERTAAVILASFFTYYVIYISLPVTGPQFYYLAAGVDNGAQGVFPHMGHYFATHTEALPLPGWSDGVFYQTIIDVHTAGERPTAAFPSSHVGISTIVMLLTWQLGGRKMLWWMTPLYILLCLSTVYIQAHYVVDVFGGWLSGVAFFYLYSYLFRRVTT